MALLCPPTAEEPLLPHLFARIRDRFRAHSPRRRMLLAITLALACGLLLLPWVIWAVGQTVLGPYAGGGALRFFSDFFTGLAQGSAIFWLVALGPTLFLLVFLVIAASTPK